MKCVACDHILSADEATIKSSVTGEFLDMCNPCIKESGIQGVIHSKHIKEDTVEDVSDLYDDLMNDALGG